MVIEIMKENVMAERDVLKHDVAILAGMAAAISDYLKCGAVG